ncbi:hypothetical protein M0R36_10425 [bacterium]|jgi:hypothetical protein|nr:hypothetical protein [bacterium]
MGNNITRILDYVNGKRTDNDFPIINDKKIDKIINNNIEKIIINDTEQLPVKNKEDIVTLNARSKIFSSLEYELKEFDVNSNTIRKIIKNYVAEYFKLNKTKFNYKDISFEDYGILDDIFFHIFLVLNQKDVDYNILKDVFTRLIISEIYLEKQRIILFSILDSKIYSFDTVIEKDAINIFRR